MHTSDNPGIFPQSGRLRGFILLSLSLHVVVLLIDNDRPLLPDMALGQSTLHVRLEQPRPSGKTHAMERTLRRAAVTPDPVVPSQPAADTASASATGKSVNSHEALQNYLLGALNSELTRYLTYPHLARERGWQGTVVVSVDVTPDGLLYNMRLVQSSGISLLDQTSLASLRRIRALPIAAAFEWGGPVEVILPIQFHLTNKS